MVRWSDGPMEKIFRRTSSLEPVPSSLEPLPTSVFLTSVTSVTSSPSESIAELPDLRYILTKRIRCQTSLIAKQLFADLGGDKRQL